VLLYFSRLFLHSCSENADYINKILFIKEDLRRRCRKRRLKDL
jgi:hypothetical protein